MKFDCIEAGLRSSFLRYGRFVGRHPLPFLILPVIITTALASGLLVSFSKVTDAETLYGPQNSQSRRNRVIIQDLYSSVDGHNMLVRHRTRTNARGQLIITPTDRNTNVLRESILEDVLKLHQAVMNVSIQDDGGVEYTFVDLCLMWKNVCIENELLALLDYDPKRAEATVITYPLIADQPDGAVRFIGNVLGGVLLAGEGEVERAAALQLTYHLRHDTVEDRDRGLMWEQEFLRHVEAFQTDELTIYRNAEHSFSEELDKTSSITFDLVVIVGVVLGAFCVVSTHVSDWVSTKPVLTMLGILTAGMALASTFGLMSYLGVPYANVAGALPFLILGIGVDDMFIMISAWRRTDRHKPSEERLSETLEESAFSIFITSITDTIAFSIGCISQFYSIQLLCLYAAVSVLFAYVYIITFFAACMVITGHREKANRHAITFKKVLPKDESPSKSYRLFCAGGTPSKAQESHKGTNALPFDPILTVFFRKYFGPFVTHPVSAAIIVIIYLAYVGVAVWGITGLEEGLDLKNIGSDNSFLNVYYPIEQSYFRVYGPQMSIVATEEIRYWDTDVRDILENTVIKLEFSEYFHGSSLTISWLREYLKFLERIGITDPSKDVFLKTLREQFLTIPVYEQFVPDIMFDETNETIVSSRFYVVGKDLNTAARERDMFLKIRQVVRDSPFNLVAYHALSPLYLEQYIAIRHNTILILSIGVAVMFVISLVLIPSPICSLIVTFSVISTVFGLLGYMSLWNVSLDSISMIGLIPSLGFSVDFSAHISYAYISASKDSRRQQSIYALYTLGTPILQGALSTIVALIALVFLDSYIFRTFFKTMLLVIAIGALHGLVFLPVFLMLIVPNKSNLTCCGQRDERRKAKSGKEIGDVNPAFESHTDNIEFQGPPDYQWNRRTPVIKVVYNPGYRVKQHFYPTDQVVLGPPFIHYK